MNERELRQRYPRASDAFIRANCDSHSRLCAVQQQQSEGSTLERFAQGKAPCPPRFEIRFTIFASRPFDWDGYHVKEMQDALVRTGILHDDNWRVLQGVVISQKAYQAEEEKTVIEIVAL